MAKFSLAGTPNAAQSRLVLNDKLTTQGFYETSVGCDTAGVHIQTGACLSPDAKLAWKEYIDGIYTSVLNVTSVSLNWDAKHLAKYLTFTYWADVALSEARRDITMLNMADGQLVSAQIDFFGPGYQSLSQTRDSGVSVEMKKAMVDRYNNAARKMSTSYPHPSFPMKDVHTYLVGNVFCDDNTDRTNYIYFHCMNRSLHSDAPNAAQALDAFDNLVSEIEKDVEFRHHMQSMKSQFLKLYGDAAIYHPLYLNEDDKPRLVYDATLLDALTNAEYVPALIFGATDQDNVGRDITWTAQQTSAASLVKQDATALYDNGPTFQYYTKQQLLPGATLSNLENLQHQLNYNPRLFTGKGKQFSGEEAAARLMFSQTMFVMVDESGSSIALGIMPISHCGITLGMMWCNANSQLQDGTWIRYWLINHTANIADGLTVDNYTIAPQMHACLRTLSQCKFGRAKVSNIGVKATALTPENPLSQHNYAFESAGTSYVPCGDIDEYAVYTDIQALVHTMAAAYFTIGTQVYKPVNDTKSVQGLAAVSDSSSKKKDNNRPHKGKGGKF